MLTDNYMSMLKRERNKYKVYDMTCGPEIEGERAVPGLFALVPTVKNHHKWWRIKYIFRGKEGQLSLGVWPMINCTEARRRAMEIRTMVAMNIDPSKERKRRKHKQGT